MTRIWTRRIKILGANEAVYSAWVPIREGSLLSTPYHTVTRYDDRWYGRVGTGASKDFDVAYDAIVEAFPEAKVGRRHDGEIRVGIETSTESEETWR